MADLHTLKPAAKSRSKRLRAGRGDAARRGNYSGRGSKGQKARGSIHPRFEGGQLPLIKKLPAMRGFTNKFRVPYQVVNLDKLAQVATGTKVTLDNMLQLKLVRKKSLPVKILGSDAQLKKLEIHAHAFSKGALAAIEKSGGKGVVVPFKNGSAKDADAADDKSKDEQKVISE